MHPKCKQAVNAAAGKPLTEKQLQAIEDGITAARKRLSKERADWGTLTNDQQMIEGAKSVMEGIKAKAKRDLENAEKQILLSVRVTNEIGTLQESFADTPGHSGSRAEATKRHFENTHIRIAAERKFAFAGLTDLIKAAGDKKGAGMGRRFLMTVFNAENPVMTRDIVREIYKNADGHTGNEAATAAARAWLDTNETLRSRFNSAGGDIGKLDYGWAPQLWDTSKVRKFRAEFARDVLPHVDRSRYVKEDGARMNDAEVLDFLEHSAETLATEGLNKTEPGQFKGAGARANRGSKNRQIHFADGDAHLAVMSKYGKSGIYDAMMGHVGGIVRDIGLIETYGPNATANARLQMDLVKHEDAAPISVKGRVAEALRTDPETYWDMVSGKTGSPANETMASTMGAVRNINASQMLGGALISSIGDIDTVIRTTGYNRLPYWRLLADVAKQGSKAEREMMATHGMIAESAANAINRWSGDNLGTGWSGHMAAATFKWSFLNAWTDGWRQGFTKSMNAKMAQMAKSAWADLHEFDRVRFTRAQITEADWAVLNKVAPAMENGRELLSPWAIKRSDHPEADTIAAKVFGFIHDESEYAVINPDLEARARITWGGTQAGTAAGEISRTVMQFKSFPVSMITRHWSRVLEGDLGTPDAPVMANRYVNGLMLAASTLTLGAFITQINQLRQGKDPIDMNKGRFWAKSALQGGGLSVLGDVFLIDPANSAVDSATTAIKNLAGPTVGKAADLILKNLVENVWQAAEGKSTHWQAEIFNWAKSQVPGNNIWWLKPLIEHGITNELNEMLSPGYLAKQQQRAMKDWGQRYWWAPKDKVPQRAPDLAAAVK